ncbi:glycosyltransferase family 39 protein [bacterium]|nr:glycosyltransferase family 39 protein [bacterium]
MLVASLLSAVAGLAGARALALGHPLGLLGLAIGALLLRWPVSLWTVPPPPELAPRARRWLLLGVTAVAAGFRCYRLDQPGLWGDDAINGLLAFDVLDGRITSPFALVAHAHSVFHALSSYPVAAAFHLFGADLWTLRLPGVLMGIAGAPLLYAIAAPLFGARAGLLAALIYASSPPQLTHAKQLVQIITGEFLLLAGLALLVQGWSAARRWWVVVAGIPLALSVCTYHATRIAPLIAVAYVAAAWRQQRRSPARRIGGGTLLLLLLVFAAALAPAIVGYVRDPDALTHRVNATSIWVTMREAHSWRPLWEATWRTLGMFHYQQGPEYHWFGLGFDPAFNVVVGALLAHGLIASLLGWRQPRHVLLLVWVAIGLAPGILSGGAPRLYRSLLATPPLYIWSALPLAQMLAAARASTLPALRATALALAIAVPLIDSQYYFYRVYTHPLFHWYQGERLVEMARTLRRRGAGWTGYLLADVFDANHETFRFLARAWHLDIEPVASLADVLPLREPPPRGALFMMSEAALPAADAVRAIYPEAGPLSLRHEPALRSWFLDRWWPLASWPDPPRPVAGFVAVDRAALAHPRLQPPIGLNADYDFGSHTLVRREPYPFYAFLTPTFSAPFSARFSGRLRIPADGYRLDVDSNGAWTMRIDDREVGPGDALTAGWHAVELALRGVPPTLRLRIEWSAPRQKKEPVPPDAFAP